MRDLEHQELEWEQIARADSQDSLRHFAFLQLKKVVAGEVLVTPSCGNMHEKINYKSLSKSIYISPR